MSSFVDLSHVITAGMETYPGLPTPEISPHLTREAAEEIYGPGITFTIGMVNLCTNTGTYLDVPYHRYADGHDLTKLDLTRVAEVPAICLDRTGQEQIDLRAEDFDDGHIGGLSALAGMAVLIRTDHAIHFGTPAYTESHPHLSAASAELLAAANVACVGIDSLNIDGTSTGERPVHSTLLKADIPIIEHLTALDQLPVTGFRFTAVPPKIEHAGTFTVRAFATVD